MSRSGDAVKLTSHLALLEERTPATCMICHELKDSGEPLCERCGLGVFHLQCYVQAIALAPEERRFWTTRSAAEAEALAALTPFLCPGCRS